MTSPHEEAVRRRRIIFNNDGDDAMYFSKTLEATPQEFLKVRATPVLNTQVTTVAYCTTASFGLFTHNTQIGEVFSKEYDEVGLGKAHWSRLMPEVQAEFEDVLANKRCIVPDLIAQGADPLELTVGLCHENDIEVFSSFRMNDVHDGQGFEAFLPDLKRERPDLLVGSREDPPPYGWWTGVDYGKAEVRDLQLQYMTEVCDRYDIDGLELDFWRHPPYFKNQAWGGPVFEEEVEAMTDLLRATRQMTRDVEERRDRPILIAVRVLESAEMSLHCGLDIETWLKDGLVDMLITGMYRLAPWEDLIELGHTYGVPVYPNIDRASGSPERSSIELFRAQALHAWGLGADGIHLFNIFPEKRTDVYSELGDPAILERRDKVYGVYPVGHSGFRRYVLDVERFIKVPVLSPMEPKELRPALTYRFELYVADSLDGDMPEAKLRLDVPGLDDPTRVRVWANDHRLPEGDIVDEHVHFAVDPTWLETGYNRLDLQPTLGNTLVLHDIFLDLRYGAENER